jgi:hypothetical protein
MGVRWHNKLTWVRPQHHQGRAPRGDLDWNRWHDLQVERDTRRRTLLPVYVPHQGDALGPLDREYLLRLHLMADEAQLQREVHELDVVLALRFQAVDSRKPCSLQQTHHLGSYLMLTTLGCVLFGFADGVAC